MARVLLPPPVLFLIVLGAGIAAHLLMPIPKATDLTPAGALLAAAGLAVIVTALATLHRGGVDPSPYAPTAALVTSGPYRFTRNPVYLGMAVATAGLGLVFDSAWPAFLLVPAWPVLVRGIVVREEAALAAQFPDLYPAYCAKVRRWL